jgi:hypothetical protein
MSSAKDVVHRAGLRLCGRQAAGVRWGSNGHRYPSCGLADGSPAIPQTGITMQACLPCMLCVVSTPARHGTASLLTWHLLCPAVYQANCSCSTLLHLMYISRPALPSSLVYSHITASSTHVQPITTLSGCVAGSPASPSHSAAAWTGQLQYKVGPTRVAACTGQAVVILVGI